jgi:hypothetical protein
MKKDGVDASQQQNSIFHLNNTSQFYNCVHSPEGVTRPSNNEK